MKSQRTLTRGVLAWAVLGVAISLAMQWLFEQYWLRSALAPIAWAAIGLVLVGRRLWDARRPETRRGAFAAAGAVVFIGLLVVLASPFAAQLGASVIERLRFARNEPLYQQIVKEVEASPSGPGRHERDGVVYLVDPGPPLRLAFPWPSGIITGWCGAVYDPTGEVMRINDVLPDGSNRDDARLAGATAAFGGGMTDCHELGEDYYLCCFAFDLDGEPAPPQL